MHQERPIGIGFARGDESREVQTLLWYANYHKIPRRFFSDPTEVPREWLPVGSVEWVSGALRRQVTPDYYPAFLSDWLLRRVWRTETWPTEGGVFLKPADRYKRFNGFVAGKDSHGEGPCWCSDVVEFQDEWRYYVSDGHVIAAHWYAGDEQRTPDSPDLPVCWPAGWCGAADFGRLTDGRIALVEAHHPFACGWYGRLSEGQTFARWLVTGWRYLNNAIPAD